MNIHFGIFFMDMKKIIGFILLLWSVSISQSITPVRIQYGGGGDWYGNKTTWVNILNKVKNEYHIPVGSREVSYRITDPEFRQHPISYIAGHGNISFTDEEAAALRVYLTEGGFLFADDDYGMDKSFRREMKKVFPELNFTELPFSHPIYHVIYNFDRGLPKIHEHAGGAPAGYGLIHEGRLVCFYSFNTDISDGCEDPEIHNDPQETRVRALEMAVNIFMYALLN